MKTENQPFSLIDALAEKLFLLTIPFKHSV